MTRRLKIAQLGLRGVPATYGGVEVHVEQLGARLAARGHDVTVFCRPNYIEERLDDYLGMHLEHVRTIPSKHFDAIVHSALSALKTVGRGYDIVHVHAIGPGAVAPIPRALTGAKVVQTIHGLDGDRAKWSRPAQFFLNAATWMSARVPHRTITVSRTLAAHYLDEYRRECSYIPNGITASEPRAPAIIRDKHGLQAQGYVLFVGRLVPEKAPDLLLRAYADLDTNLPLVIAGGSSFTDDFRTELNSLAAADDRVRMLGYVYGDELAELYTNAAVFVLPSSLEGLPLTLLEAIGASLPVIASDIPPHAEVLAEGGAGGRLFPAGDRASLRAALAAALAAIPAERAGAAERQAAVLEHYNWDAAADQLEALYLDLIR